MIFYLEMNQPTKILIVDDSQDLLEALKIFLEHKLYEVCAVISKESLENELKNFKPDIIILDIYIKGMGDGREVCRTIKSAEETQKIPIILMSADYKALENYVDCLADAILEKPFHLSELVLKVESLIVSRL